MIGKYAEQLKEGDTFTSHRRTITEADVVMFTSLTWITDPIFTDESFAKRLHFGGRAVPGPMLVAYGLGLTEELVYGTTLAALGINNVRFSRSVRPGATIQVHTAISSHRESNSRPGTSIIVFRHEVVTIDDDRPACTFERTMLIGSREYLDDLGVRTEDQAAVEAEHAVSAASGSEEAP